jgi:hypothetical protein
VEKEQVARLATISFGAVWFGVEAEGDARTVGKAIAFVVSEDPAEGAIVILSAAVGDEEEGIEGVDIVAQVKRVVAAKATMS